MSLHYQLEDHVNFLVTLLSPFYVLKLIRTKSFEPFSKILFTILHKKNLLPLDDLELYNIFHCSYKLVVINCYESSSKQGGLIF